MQFRPYERDDLDAVIGLCLAEGWPSIPADHERGHRMLTNPGVTTFVAVDGDDAGGDDPRRDADTVVGFINLLSDGEVQAYIATMAVAASHRRRGIGTRLIKEALAASGAQRVDLLSDADDFYRQLVHERWVGFRLYPPIAP